jgi:hypothetical protein
MDRFLCRDAFPGREAGELHAGFMGEARFDGCLAFSNWPRWEVERLLPAELKLAVNTSAAPEVHPVAFMFGVLRQTTILFGGLAIPTGVDYHEFLMAIPFVKQRRGRYLHTYMARMYSSVPTSVLVGNTYYGFSKSLARMQWQGPIFLVTSADGALLLTHMAVEDGQGSPPAVNLASMRAALSLPIVGRKTDGSLICSYFGFDFSAGEVGAADACISIDAPIVAGLTPRTVYDSPSGTVRVRDVIWRLSWPFPCRC